MSQFMQDSEQYYFTVRDTFEVAHRILNASKELPENKAFIKDFNDMGELFCAMENAIISNPDSTGNITYDIAYQILVLCRNEKFACMLMKRRFYQNMLIVLKRANRGVPVDPALRHALSGMQQKFTPLMLQNLNNIIAPEQAVRTFNETRHKIIHQKIRVKQPRKK